jgi:hypothetical protein
MSEAAIALALGSALVGEAGNQDLEQRRRKIAKRMDEFQGEKARQGQQSIEKFIAQIDPARRAAESSDIRGELQRGLESSVGASAALSKPDNFAGKVTENYTGRRASNEATTKERLRRAMEQLAVIGTPAERNMRTGFALSDATSGVGAANSSIASTGRAYTRAADSLRPDPFLSFVSQALGGVSRAGSGVRL